MEPILNQRDRDVWSRWAITALRHSRTRTFQFRVDAAKRVASKCLEASPDSVVMWSAGKDSTVLSHLLTVGMGAGIPLVSEKDDLDYPGEVEYIEALASQWEANLQIIVPEVSPQQWITENCKDIPVDGDFHSRAAGLSKACFYDLVESKNGARDAIFLGLRKHESPGRAANRMARGLLYQRKPSKHSPQGQWVCNPLGDWEGLDVYAYLISQDIPLLPVYRCVGFMHAERPWEVRKSWWIPGGAARMGGIAWLHKYWPSLYSKLNSWFPAAQSYL